MARRRPPVNVAVAAPEPDPDDDPQTPQYTYRSGFRSPVPPEVAGERIAAIQAANNGIIVPKQVVDDARPVAAPLHPHFEWRDPVAAEKWREHTAAALIVSLRVKDVAPPGAPTPIPKPAHVKVNHPEHGRGYVTLQTAFSNTQMRDDVLAEARQAYRMLQARYEYLEELASVHAAIDEI